MKILYSISAIIWSLLLFLSLTISGVFIYKLISEGGLGNFIMMIIYFIISFSVCLDLIKNERIREEE